MGETALVAPCNDRMPGSIAQAFPGGTSPGTEYRNVNFNTNTIEVKNLEEAGTWVTGSSEEDKKRYLDLMNYMEERRVQAREMLKEEEERKECARKKEESWALLRESTAFLRVHEDGWRMRRIQECERIKEEERVDRLALVREKKKKYGIRKISKEENLRLKGRTEERIEISVAKSNLWKKFREGSRVKKMGEKEEAA